jgi:hypothetical protein
VTPQPGISPDKSSHGKKRLSRRAIDNIVSRREDRLLSACGCVIIPSFLIRVLGNKQPVYCESHGWQDAIRKITPREAYNHAMELPLDTPAPEVPENPAF